MTLFDTDPYAYPAADEPETYTPPSWGFGQDDDTTDPFADDDTEDWKAAGYPPEMPPKPEAPTAAETFTPPTPEKTMTTIPVTTTDTKTIKEIAAFDAVKALSALMETATPAIDAETVRDMIKSELAQHGPQRVQIQIGEFVSPDIDGPLPVNFYRVLKLMNARQNTALIGPAGSGKTYTARHAAEALGLRFASISVTAGMSEGSLLGRLLPTGDGGKFEYSQSQFVDFYENGGCFLLDELDAADANTLLVINTALANGHLPLPSRLDKPEAKRHADFVCIACANTYGNGADRQYVGREQLDAATLDRFRAGIVSVDYDATVEESLIDAEFLVWARSMRERITATKLRRFVSTRFLLDATRLLALKMASRPAILDSYFADWSTDEKAKVGELAPSVPYDVTQEMQSKD